MSRDKNTPKIEIRVEFNTAWHKIMAELLMEDLFQDISRIMDWLEFVMEANVPCGKQFRGMALIHIYRSLIPDRNPENDFLSYVLGWCIEILQAAALIVDDIMDAAETRRGKPCWYKLEEVQLSAVNDSLMLETIGGHILLKYFSGKTCCLQLHEMVQHIKLKTIFGQCLDTKLGQSSNLDEFTQKTYESVVKYKTSYYTFYCPVALAMILAGITDKDLYRTIEDVTLIMGYMFQMQDDFLDCYGNPDITGKIGTDIVDGKCSWLIVKALELASPEQRNHLHKVYGSKVDGNEEIVKSIYSKLDLVGEFKRHEQETYATVIKFIKLLPQDIAQEPFRAMLTTMYKRNK